VVDAGAGEGRALPVGSALQGSEAHVLLMGSLKPCEVSEENHRFAFLNHWFVHKSIGDAAEAGHHLSSTVGI
jgi:hypothetical protein